MNYDDLPKFERFPAKWRKQSTAKRRALAPNCLHKKPYNTAAKAEQALVRRLASGVPFLRVYRCPDCRAWHLTHKPV
jgi:hypothetical protein